MSACQAPPMILAIGNRDDFIHVYRDDRELLSDDDIGAGVGEISGPLEFFNSDGYRLTGVYDRRWHLLRLVPTADPRQPHAIQKRVCNVIDHLRSHIERNPEEAALYGMTVDEMLELIPRISTSTDLETSLRAFLDDADHGPVVVAESSGEDERRHNRKHNMAHRFGWRHG